MLGDKLRPWGRILLPAALLFILIEGLILTPEVRLKFAPETVQEDQLRSIKSICDKAGAYLLVLESELTALSIPAEFKTKSHFEKRHYLARRRYTIEERRLKYLEVKLDNLSLSFSSPPSPGINHNRNVKEYLRRERIAALRQQCRGYRIILNQQADRLERLGNYSNIVDRFSEPR